MFIISILILGKIKHGQFFWQSSGQQLVHPSDSHCPTRVHADINRNVKLPAVY